MKILDLFGYQLVAEWRRFSLLAVISGISGAFVLATINSAALSSRDNEATAQTVLMLGLAIGLFVLSQKALMIMAAELAERTVDDMRIRLLSTLLSAELQGVERLNRSEIYSCINSELRIISDGAVSLIITMQSMVLMLMIMVYLAFLSFMALLVAVAFIVIGAAIHFRRTHQVIQDYEELFRLGTKMADGFSNLIDGFKEVKLNLTRSRELDQDLRAISTRTRVKTLDVRQIFASDFITSQLAFFLLTATMVFVVPQLSSANAEAIAKITMTSLFVVGPINNVIGGLPMLQRMNAAADAVLSLQNRLRVLATSPTSSGVDLTGFERLRLDSVTFRYPTPTDEAGFQIGPLSLEICRGQVVFISGGNGSGKSTLLKLIAGLYRPTSGQIILDDQVIGPENIVAYRNLFSAIFSDYHLFRKLYGISQIDEAKVAEFLRLLELEGKVRVVNKAFDTVALSTGQRKRLAMVVLLLEDRPICIFDEWAADQDAHMREKFYREILSLLRSARKTVFVVTHDERYFDVADVRFNMEDGRLQAILPFNAAPPDAIAQ